MEGQPPTTEELQARIAELERKLRERDQEPSTGVARTGESSEVAPLSELDTTLRRLIQRIAMILQAEKVVMMFATGRPAN